MHHCYCVFLLSAYLFWSPTFGYRDVSLGTTTGRPTTTRSTTASWNCPNSESSNDTSQEESDHEKGHQSSWESIVGTKRVHVKRFPHTYCSLAYFASARLYSGGALINRYWAIVDAGVSYGEDLREIHLKGGGQNALQGQGRNVVMMIVHPNASRYGFINDVTLAKLEKPFRVSKRLRWAPIADRLPKDGTKVVNTGYIFTGPPDNFTQSFRMDGILRALTMPIYNWKECKKLYTESRMLMDETDFCLETIGETSGPCSYNPGTPVTYKGELIGMFAGSRGRCRKGEPLVYVNLPRMKSWIENTVRENSSPAEIRRLKRDGFFTTKSN